MKPLRVGIATANITPEGAATMAGFGFRKKPSEGVGRPITASCVAFDNTVMRVTMERIGNVGRGTVGVAAPRLAYRLRQRWTCRQCR